MTFDRTSAVAVAHVLAVAVEFLLEWSLHVQFIVIVSARVQVRVSQKGWSPPLSTPSTGSSGHRIDVVLHGVVVDPTYLRPSLYPS